MCMKIPRGVVEKSSAAGQPCKIGEGNRCNCAFAETPWDRFRFQLFCGMGGAKRYPSPLAPALMGIASLHPSYEDAHSHSRDTLRPRFAITFALEVRGRREDRVRAAPAVSRARCANKNAHEHTGSAETLRPSLRSGVTAYFVLSPENGSFASVAAQGVNPAQLDASTAAPGPHDFTVRLNHSRRSWFSRPLHLTARS